MGHQNARLLNKWLVALKSKAPWLAETFHLYSALSFDSEELLPLVDSASKYLPEALIFCVNMT